MPSEADCLARARRGDTDAFADLVQPHQSRVFNLALRVLGDAEDAADVTQDALVRAYTRLQDFRGDAAFGTWLYRIVHNMCLDALRWRARHPSESLVAGGADGAELQRQLADPSEPPDETVLRRERQQQIALALAELSPEFRTAVVLRDVQGLAYEEVAAITGASLGTVKSRLHRARLQLRDLLTAEEPRRPVDRQTE